MNNIYDIMIDKIHSRKVTVGVLGLGYVGLPLVMELVSSGYRVVGIDPNKNKVELLREGKTYILDIPQEQVEKSINNKFYPTWEFDKIGELDIVIICVPTPLNKNQEPDISYLQSAADSILAHMKKPLLILIESTTYPGTTREIFDSRFEAAGKQLDRDYFLCFSPERIDPGNKKFQTKNIPKVIGGITKQSSKIAEIFYKSVLDEVFLVSTPEAAEMSKLLENTFRSINIAFINEMAIMCERMGLNIWEAIDGAATKPFGFMPFYPGAGVGGHCIPLDPMYLQWKGKQSKFFNKFIEIAQDINMNMPYHVVNKISEVLNDFGKPLKGAKILLIGVAYKADINDVRESPSLDVYQILKNHGVDITVLDSFVPSFRDQNGEDVVVKDENSIKFKDYDCSVILTRHSTVDYEKLLRESLTIIDMQRTYKDSTLKKVHTIGGHSY